MKQVTEQLNPIEDVIQDELENLKRDLRHIIDKYRNTVSFEIHDVAKNLQVEEYVACDKVSTKDSLIQETIINKSISLLSDMLYKEA